MHLCWPREAGLTLGSHKSAVPTVVNIGRAVVDKMEVYRGTVVHCRKLQEIEILRDHLIGVEDGQVRRTDDVCTARETALATANKRVVSNVKSRATHKVCGY